MDSEEEHGLLLQQGPWQSQVAINIQRVKAAAPLGWEWLTYKIYMMTPRDHMSQDLSYFSGPSTSGAGERKEKAKSHKMVRKVLKRSKRGQTHASPLKSAALI